MEISFNAFIFLDFSRLPCIRHRIELITKKCFYPLKLCKLFTHLSIIIKTAFCKFSQSYFEKKIRGIHEKDSPHHMSGNVVSSFQHNGARNKFFPRIRNMLSQLVTPHKPCM